MGILDFFKSSNKGEEQKSEKPPEEKEGMDKGLHKTKQGFFSKIARAVVGKSKVDAQLLDDLEEALITSDVGVDTTLKIIDRIEKRVAKDKYMNTEEFEALLKDEVVKLMEEGAEVKQTDFTIPEQKDPYVIMVVGVNGVGKTTTIGKLAHKFKNQGLDVMLGGADTFRAAAIDQLKAWGDRVEVPVMTREMGSDPAAVAYDTVNSAKANDKDVAIIDTAGRLHNKKNLMRELGKIKRVMQKIIPDAPHEVLLILDASTGQNAIEQAKQFTEITDVTDIALAKLDGTAKGGVIIGIADQFNIPIKYVGIGETVEDLRIFDKSEFVESLFKKEIA